MAVFSQILFLGVVSGIVLAPLVVSFSMFYGTTRIFHFPHATICLLGVYFAWWMHQQGLPLIVALPTGVLASLLLGGLVSLGIYLPLMRRRASEMGLLMAALGLFLVLEHATALSFSPSPHIFLGSHTTVLNTGLVRITPIQVTVFCSSLTAVIVLWLVLANTGVGRSIRSFASNPELARALGMTDKYILLCTTGLGILIGSVTMFSQVAYSGILSPEVSVNAAIAAAACGTLFGPRKPLFGLVASVFLGIGQSVSGLALGAQWETSFALVVLMMGLVVRRCLPAKV